MTTVKRYLINNKAYNGYMITKATSGLDFSSISSPTNQKQAVELTNSVLGITKQFSTMKSACLYLGISYRRLSNYLKNNESNSGGRRLRRLDTIKGYSIKLVEVNDGVNKVYSKVVEVTDVRTNEVTIYPSVSSAAESLGISSASISTARSC